jgi:CelD/BcsL family acetyltransferase involved in cellulose biosynthesis
MDVHSTLTGTPSTRGGSGRTADSPSSKPSPSYSAEKITAEEGLLDLKEDWNRLSEAAVEPNAFTTFDWFLVWNRCLTLEGRSGQRRLNVVVIKRNGMVAGISPLIHREASRFGWVVRKLEFVGGQGDYNDFVLGENPTAQVQAIVDLFVETQDQWDLIDLRDLRDPQNTLPEIQGALSDAGLRYRVLPEARCPFLTVDGPWSTVIGRLSPSSRRTFRKQQSRLDRMRDQGLRFRMIENPLAEPRLLEKLISLETQKHVQGELTQPFIGKYPSVFESLFETMGSRGWFYVALLELGERPLAWQLWLRSGTKLWGFLTAYDHSFARLSPGTMLVPAVIDYAYAHGYTECDFLRGEEPYKMRWTTGCHQTYRLVVWNRRWTSRAQAFLYLDLKSAVYRLMGNAALRDRGVPNAANSPPTAVRKSIND